MRALGVSNTWDVDNQTPGLIITGFSGGGTTVFNIRGAGQLDFNDQQEAPVAVYIDGAYNSYLAGVGFNFYDLERIEVLRGPQGRCSDVMRRPGWFMSSAINPLKSRKGMWRSPVANTDR